MERSYSDSQLLYLIEKFRLLLSAESVEYVSRSQLSYLQETVWQLLWGSASLGY